MSRFDTIAVPLGLFYSTYSITFAAIAGLLKAGVLRDDKLALPLEQTWADEIALGAGALGVLLLFYVLPKLQDWNGDDH